ncbi:MAG TPA: hypothetical protein VI485_25825 [Vicinamibacterales bacterium]|nr:hypothetical protein [Vicinamibacterales bacterium]
MALRFNAAIGLVLRLGLLLMVVPLAAQAPADQHAVHRLHADAAAYIAALEDPTRDAYQKPHIENQAGYLAVLKKQLKPGGQVVMIDFHKREIPVGPPVGMKIACEDLLKQMQQNGFSS